MCAWEAGSCRADVGGFADGVADDLGDGLRGYCFA